MSREISKLLFVFMIFLSSSVFSELPSDVENPLQGLSPEDHERCVELNEQIDDLELKQKNDAKEGNKKEVIDTQITRRERELEETKCPGFESNEKIPPSPASENI